MRIKISSIILIAVMMLSFLWFVGVSQSYIIDEQWSPSVDPPSFHPDPPPYIEFSGKGSLLYNGDVVDEEVRESNIFRVKLGVSFYKITYKVAVWGRNGFRQVEMVGENYCGEYEDDNVSVARIGNYILDIQNIISPGQRVRDVVASVRICMSFDIVEMPEGVKAFSIFVNGIKIKHFSKGEAYIANIPAGEGFKKTYEVKIKYYDELEGVWKEHVFKNKIDIEVRWKKIKSYEVGVDNMSVREWCLDFYSDDVGPLKYFKSREQLERYCSSLYVERVYLYDVSKAIARTV